MPVWGGVLRTVMSTHLRNHSLRCAIAAAAGAAALVWLGPPGADLAAHVYQRAMFIQHGFALWSNYWYAGHYSYVTYSVLYYPLAAVIGIKLLAVASAAVAAGAFASLVRSEWPTAGLWPARAFAFVAAVSVLSGAYPYALGLAIGLLALRSARGDARIFAILVALTFAASPLAFGLVTLILVAAAVSARQPRIGAHGATVIILIGLGGVLWRLFPDGGRFPFSTVELGVSLSFCAVGAAFTWHVPAARLLRSFFVVYAAAILTFFVVPSGIGENIARLRFVALPIAVLAFSLRRWRPVLPAVIILVLATSWNITPLAFSYAHQSADPSARAAYWQPVVHYLHRHLSPSYRVEAVDTSGHWEAVYLPQAGIPIARGWFRQDDFPQNALLYGRLDAGAYRSWLRRLGVRYVVLTDAPPDYSARREARLLRNGRSGLSPVLRTAHATVYAVPRPRGIVTGAAGATVTRFGSSAITVRLPARGEYRVAVRYSPYWSTTDACLEHLRDGMLGLDVLHGGRFKIAFAVTATRALSAGAATPGNCP
jgi:hypothetical protein